MGVIKSAFFKLFRKFDKGYEFYLTIYLVINVIWIFLGIFFYNYSRFSYQNFSTSYVFLLIVNLFIFFLLLFLKKINFKKYDIFILLLIIFGLISTIFSNDVSVSLFGIWKRFEGYYQLLYYYSLMYLGSLVIKEKYSEWIIRFILFFGLINSFICFLQVFDILKFINVNMRGTSLGQGLMTNSNFFGSYMILCLGISLGMYLFCDKVKSRYIYFFASLIFYSGLLMSNALSGVIGFLIVCFLILIYFVYMCIKNIDVKNNIFKHVLLLISFILVFIFLSCSGKTIIGRDFSNFSRETVEIAKGNANDNYGSFRIFIWKNTLKVVPKYWLHGVGIDNFINAFDQPLFLKTSKTEITYFDKVHNEYLQKLVCEGVFSCITYIVMLFILFVKSIKNIIKRQKYIIIALFLGFVGYCVQAFFNISVIEVAPLFWLVMGILYDRKAKCDNVL